ncbi:uncharacterized protein METZ01_LOCUS401442, partial [marine metagenome]
VLALPSPVIPAKAGIHWANQIALAMPARNMTAARP